MTDQQDKPGGLESQSYPKSVQNRGRSLGFLPEKRHEIIAFFAGIIGASATVFGAWMAYLQVYPPSANQNRFYPPPEKPIETPALSPKTIATARPDHRFNHATRDSLKFFVDDAAASQSDNDFVISLRNALERHGFQLATDRKDAALITTIEIKSITAPEQDLTQGFLAWTVTAHVAFRVSWAIDNSVLIEKDIVGAGRSNNQGKATADGLLDALNTMIESLSSLAEK